MRQAHTHEAGRRAVGRAGEKGDACWASQAAGRAWEEEERAAEWTKAGKKREGGREGDWACSWSWAK